MASELDNLGLNVVDESAERLAVEAAVVVDASPDTMKEQQMISKAQDALQALEDQYDKACESIDTLPSDAPLDLRAQLIAQKKTLERQTTETAKRVAEVTKIAKLNRARRLADEMDKQQRQRAAAAAASAAAAQEASSNQAGANGPHHPQRGGVDSARALGVNGRPLLNGAVSASRPTLLSARRAQRALDTSLDSRHVGTRVGAATASGRRAGTRGEAAPTDAVLDYRGGETVHESALRLTAAMLRQRKRQRDGAQHHAGIVDDGDESRYLARMEESRTRATHRSERRAIAAAAATAENVGASANTLAPADDADMVYLDRLTASAADSLRVPRPDGGDDLLLDDEATFSVSSSTTASDADDDEDDEPDVPVANGYSIPAKVWVNLLDYQQDGVRWLVDRHHRRTGGILGDEMGLGKTIQAAALLSCLQTSNKLRLPVLILAPLTVLQQWVAELRKWAPALRVVVLHSSGSSSQSREDLLQSVRNQPVIIISTYTTAMLEVERIDSLNPQMIILDEGHKISNPDAGITLAVKSFNTPHRIILSGSPIQNTLKELWCLFDFVAPGALGTMSAFVTEFEDPVKASRNPSASPMEIQTAIECARVLRDHIAPYMLRRLKRDVNTMLPPKHEKIIRCELTDEQLQEYLNVLGSHEVQDFKRRVLRTREQIGRVDRNGRMENGALQDHRSYGRMSEGLMRSAFKSLTDLRSITNHADLFSVKVSHKAQGGEAGYVSFRSNQDVDLAKSGKLRALDILMRKWKAEGHRVLIFSQTRMMLDIIENLVEQRGLRYFRMDGTTASHHRQQLIDCFNGDDSIFCALLTTRVGGLGVNLVGADRVVIFDPDWNPVTDEQARERAWRIGQTREVVVYRMVTAGTVEEHILHRQLAKLYVAEKVLSDPTLQRSFHLASLSDAFLLGPEYKSRVDAASRHLLSNDSVNVEVEVERGQRTFDRHGNTIPVGSDDAKKEEQDGADVKTVRPSAITMTENGVYSNRVKPSKGTTSRLSALEGRAANASSLSMDGGDSEAMLGVKIESMPAPSIKQERSQSQVNPAAGASGELPGVDPDAQTNMLQQLTAGGDLNDVAAPQTVAARLAQIAAHRTLHRAMSSSQSQSQLQRSQSSGIQRALSSRMATMSSAGTSQGRSAKR